MPNLTEHQSRDYVKMLLLGDAKSGKTSSLASLVAAGYKLRIIDMDNLLDSLVHRIRAIAPDRLDTVEYRTLRDQLKMTATGPILSGAAKAFPEAMKMLDRWRYKDEAGNEIDLGSPASWSPECILVIDSLSRLCDAAYDWAEAMMPAGKSGEKDGRAIYGSAQNAIESLLASLTAPQFTCNTIVICHGQYMDLPDGTTKIFPQGVGQKLSPKIPQYFPTYVRFKNQGGKRTLQLKSDAMIDLAVPEIVGDKLDPETGLAELFEALRGPLETKPTTQLKRKA